MLPVDNWTMWTILRGRGVKVEALIYISKVLSHFFLKKYDAKNFVFYNVKVK